MPAFRSTSDATQLQFFQASACKTWSADGEHRGEEDNLRTWGIGNEAAECAPTTIQSPTAPQIQPGEREEAEGSPQIRLGIVADSEGPEPASQRRNESGDEDALVAQS